MITYSRQDVERQLVADSALWRRVPVSLIALVWPLEVVLLGWGVGWWAGAATVVLLGVASIALPPRLKVSIYLIDLLERFLGLPLAVGWLLMVWHLGLRDPVFPLLGQPLIGAAIATFAMWLLTRPLAFLARSAAQRALSNG